MNREREEGFFDQSGAYLFDPDEQDEAWLADAGDLDPDWVRRVTTRGKNFALEPGPGPASSAGGSAAPEAMAALLAEHLRPGETPIEALRRLGGVRERVSRKKAQFRDAQRTVRARMCIS